MTRKGPMLRKGPLFSRLGCKWVRSEYYVARGDSGFAVSCVHPRRPSINRIGCSTWRTPDWCPDLRKRAGLPTKASGPDE